MNKFMCVLYIYKTYKLNINLYLKKYLYFGYTQRGKKRRKKREAFHNISQLYSISKKNVNNKKNINIKLYYFFNYKLKKSCKTLIAGQAKETQCQNTPFPIFF